MKIPFLFITTLTALLLCGCASKPAAPLPPPEATAVFDKPFDMVWTALVVELTGENPIAISDKASGILQTQPMRIGSDFTAERVLSGYSIKPFVLMGNWSQARVIITANVVKQSDTKTSLRLKGLFEGYESNVSKQWYRCHSKGIYEQELLNKIQSALGAAAAK